MGCSGRVKEADLRPEQKWDFISLNDFKSDSCFPPFAYGYLWISLIISVAVYAVDTFTAVNLIAFNRWSGEIKPFIPLNISKWIFSACIIASWVNLGFEHIRAARVIKRGAVAESYLDSLAVRLQAVRLGKGRGWRRFLVFAELTKSKKGTEYVALFTFFSFQSWIRIIFCQGPRQVINALTLYSVFQAKLDPTDATNVGTTLTSFFKNIGILASEEHQQVVILSGMLFTLVIWIFGALSLILAVVFYLLFLWHYIPNRDGGLSGYCERKINTRLSRIVSAKVNKALEEEDRKFRKAAEKAAKKGEKPAIGRQATLPTLLDVKSDDKLPTMPMLNRNDTMATLPLYSSRPGTPNGQPTLPSFELGQMDQKRPLPSRSPTGASGMSNPSYSSNTPLIGNASDMGYGRAGSPAPSLPQLDTNNFSGAPQRSLTGSTNNSQWNRGTPGGPRMQSALGDRGYTESPLSYSDGRSGMSPISVPRSPIHRQDTTDSYGRPMPRAVGELNGRNNSGNMGGGYSPYNPNMRSASSASAAPTNMSGSQYRNMTDPGMRNQGDYFGSRPGTAANGRGTPQGRVGSGGSGYGDMPSQLGSPASFNSRNGSGGSQQGPYRR